MFDGPFAPKRMRIGMKMRLGMMMMMMMMGGPETFTAHFAVTFARYGFVITCSNLFGVVAREKKVEPGGHYDICQQFMTV